MQFGNVLQTDVTTFVKYTFKSCAMTVLGLSLRPCSHLKYLSAERGDNRDADFPLPWAVTLLFAVMSRARQNQYCISLYAYEPFGE
jgi:hypothetical protein